MNEDMQSIGVLYLRIHLSPSDSSQNQNETLLGKLYNFRLVRVILPQRMGGGVFIELT